MISTSFVLITALALLGSYLLGSIPMGLILVKLMGRGDLRKIGSGNIGATNVLRAAGLRAAILAWILDMAKVIAAVIIGWVMLDVAFGAWCAFAAIVGHCYPIWLRFRGGKGISSLFGVLLVINPFAFIVCGVEWLIVAISSGYSSLGAICAMVLAPVLMFVYDVNLGWPFLAISVLCLWRHRGNIMRLIKGDESKIEWKWKK